jgi:hypothetical protein
MIPRLQVEVSVPRACYETLGDYHAVTRFLRAAGVFPHEAQEVRWRQDVERGGYLVSYSIPVTPASLAALQAMAKTMPREAP